MNAAKWALALIILAYWFFWFGGLVSYMVLDGPPASAAWAGTLFMTLAGVLTLVYAVGSRIALLAAGAVGFGAEVLGVHVGFPFGHYAYTQVFAPLLWDVPLVMVCAWMILAGYVLEMLRPLALKAWEHAIVGGLWLTAIDLVIDPVAVGPMNLWHWDAPGWYYGIPATNFLGWFITGTAAMALARALSRPAPNRVGLRRTGLSIVLFFTWIALASGLWLAFFAGALLFAADLTLRGPAFTERRPSQATQ